MGRAPLLVAAALFGTGIAAWLATRPGPPPPAPVAAVQPAPGQPAGAEVAAPTVPPAAGPASVPAELQVASGAEFVAAVGARGLDGRQALAAWRAWRVDRGYPDGDPVTGAAGEPAVDYAGMDRASLKALADTPDRPAMEAYAARILAEEPTVATGYLARASAQGSAAAMVAMADALATASLGSPRSDPRLESGAWLLALIRRHGPLVATPDVLERLAQLGLESDPALEASACASSLGVLAGVAAAAAGPDAGELPPAFLAEPGFYDRLPCRGTPAPVTPPRALGGCRATPARGPGGRPVELWVCGET